MRAGGSPGLEGGEGRGQPRAGPAAVPQRARRDALSSRAVPGRAATFGPLELMSGFLFCFLPFWFPGPVRTEAKVVPSCETPTGTAGGSEQRGWGDSAAAVPECLN